MRLFIKLNINLHHRDKSSTFLSFSRQKLILLLQKSRSLFQKGPSFWLYVLYIDKDRRVIIEMRMSICQI